MRIGLPVFPWWIAGLVPVHILVSQTLYAIIGGDGEPILGDALDETKETVRAIIFLVVAIWAYGRATATHSVARADVRRMQWDHNSRLRALLAHGSLRRRASRMEEHVKRIKVVHVTTVAQSLQGLLLNQMKSIQSNG